jgi:hypothetical protein
MTSFEINLCSKGHHFPDKKIYFFTNFNFIHFSNLNIHENILSLNINVEEKRVKLKTGGMKLTSLVLDLPEFTQKIKKFEFRSNVNIKIHKENHKYIPNQLAFFIYPQNEDDFKKYIVKEYTVPLNSNEFHEKKGFIPLPSNVDEFHKEQPSRNGKRQRDPSPDSSSKKKSHSGSSSSYRESSRSRSRERRSRSRSRDRRPRENRESTLMGHDLIPKIMEMIRENELKEKRELEQKRDLESEKIRNAMIKIREKLLSSSSSSSSQYMARNVNAESRLGQHMPLPAPVPTPYQSYASMYGSHTFSQPHVYSTEHFHMLPPTHAPTYPHPYYMGNQILPANIPTQGMMHVQYPEHRFMPMPIPAPSPTVKMPYVDRVVPPPPPKKD